MSEIENVTTETTDTHEYVIIGEENFKTESISTGTDSISFSLSEIAIEEIINKFSNVTELKVAGEDLKPYGVYKNLTFKSAKVDADSLVTVEFHIASKEEKRISDLEKSQEEQNVVIADILYGGDAE